MHESTNDDKGVCVHCRGPISQLRTDLAWLHDDPFRIIRHPAEPVA